VIPYLAAPALDLGFVRLELPALLAGLAILVQLQLVMQLAPRFGIERRAASTLLLWAIGLGLVGAHLFTLFVRHPEQLREDPLALLRIWREPSALGGLVGGLLGVCVVMRAKRMSAHAMLRFLDCLAFALPFTFALAALASALRHDQLGIASQHWLAVAFPDGIPRLDLGLLELLCMAPLAGLFAWLGRRPRPSGLYLALFLAVYGPVRFALDALRIVETRYLGWTPGQYFAVAATAAGLIVLAAVLRGRRAALG
jgi:prolipoprotein diacylglyceryltransferase